MSEIGTSEGASTEADKPVQDIVDVKFPPFPEITSIDFEEDVSEEERTFYKNKFPDLNAIVNVKLHCTACDRHLGCSARNETRMRSHPMLRTLICHTCHSFYNSGEFDKGEDGSELYCRWCGQGGQVYCCSDCVHVFCAKCIKRNMGIAKIKEIENTDDWKCFKCNPKCLWELRAVCWALLRYCEYRNELVFQTEDAELKEKYQKAISIDVSECCKHKGRRREKTDSAKKKEKEKEKEAENVKKIIPKLPPTIQVKKFASINLEETPKNEKKNLKRPASPKHKIGYIQKPIAIAPCSLSTPPLLKKIRMPAPPLLSTIRFANEKKHPNQYSRMPNRPRQPFPITIANTPYNGINHPYNVNMSNAMSDNINLSLETLTQGLDMASVAMNAAFNDDPPESGGVVCTPDFPLEPLCEVTEDIDDDVECITPGPVVPPKMSNPPPLVPRSLPDISSENIVQMTDNDVTVNTLTGGLKFRVDPQTLSSKRMYRLPDGRIFAINPNPNMPGGYSATIVSLSDGTNKVTPRGGETYAAKLSAITSSSAPTGSITNKTLRTSNSRKPKAKRTKKTKETKEPKEIRECDLKVPVEWFRYNLIDAVDALDYSLSRLNKLKREATTSYLRTRNVDEIKYLHRTLEQLLSTSSKRFLEVRENLNKELKQYVIKKSNTNNSGSAADMTEDDDDVEFLPNAGNDDPIFIDENSGDSFNGNESQEVDLTGAASSEHNDSAENKNKSDPLLCNESLLEKDDTTENSNNLEAQSPNILKDLLCDDQDITNEKLDADLSNKQNADLDDKEDADVSNKQNADLHDGQDADMSSKQNADLDDKQDAVLDEKPETSILDKKDDKLSDKEDFTEMQHTELNDKNDIENVKVENSDTKNTDIEDNCESSSKSIPKIGEANGEIIKENLNDDGSMEVDCNDQNVLKDTADPVEESQDTDMCEEMINSLLKDDDDTLDGMVNDLNVNSLDVSKELQQKQ